MWKFRNISGARLITNGTEPYDHSTHCISYYALEGNEQKQTRRLEFEIKQTSCPAVRNEPYFSKLLIQSAMTQVDLLHKT